MSPLQRNLLKREKMRRGERERKEERKEKKEKRTTGHPINDSCSSNHL
jgi:hypothetical protein